MTTDQERSAAKIIGDLLLPALQSAERERRHLYCWERDGIEWLREQFHLDDPDTWINQWVAERYVLNTALDLNGKMSDLIPEPNKEGTR